MDVTQWEIQEIVTFREILDEIQDESLYWRLYALEQSWECQIYWRMAEGADLEPGRYEIAPDHSYENINPREDDICASIRNTLLIYDQERGETFRPEEYPYLLLTSPMWPYHRRQLQKRATAEGPKQVCLDFSKRQDGSVSDAELVRTIASRRFEAHAGYGAHRRHEETRNA